MVKNNGIKNMKLEAWQLVLHGTERLPELRNSSRGIASSGNITNSSDIQLFRDSRNAGAAGGPARLLILLVVAVLTRYLRQTV